MPPVLAPEAIPTTLTTLSLSGNAFADLEELSRLLSGLRSLRSLDLSDCRLRALPCLPKLPLEKLDVSSNLLSSTAGVARCSRLRYATFASNRLVKTDQIEMLLELSMLDLSRNHLRSRQLLRPLAACSQLESLHLQGNPLAEAKYRAWVASMFPSLIWLDDHVLRPQRLRRQTRPDGVQPRGSGSQNSQTGAHAKDPSIEYSEYRCRYARPTISSKRAQAAQTPPQANETCEPQSKPFRAKKKPALTLTFAPAARSERSASQPVGGRRHDLCRARSPHSQSGQLRESSKSFLSSGHNGCASRDASLGRAPHDVAQGGTKSASLAASMGMQTRHAALCRELVEDLVTACTLST